MALSRSICVFFAASLLIAVSGAASPAFAQPVTRADINRDCTVTSADAALVRAALGKRTGQPGYSANADVNSDGVISAVDLAFVNRNLNARVCSAPPPAAPTIIATVTPAANANGWHNTNVTIAFTCTNATTCPRPGGGEYGRRESGNRTHRDEHRRRVGHRARHGEHRQNTTVTRRPPHSLRRRAGRR